MLWPAAYEHVLAFLLNLEGFQIDACRFRQRFTSWDMEAGLVEWTFDLVVLDEAVGQASELVAAYVVDRIELARNAANGDLPVADGDHARLIFAHLCDLGGI